MTPYTEVKCPRCKGSGEEPVRDEDGCLVRDLCSYCGGCGEWLDIVSGPWMWSACVGLGDAPCYAKGIDDGEAMMVALSTAWGRRGRPTRCTAHGAVVTEVFGG